MKATDLIRRQHQELDYLFRMIVAAQGEEREAIRDTLAKTLRAHTAMEEESFYPVLELHPDFGAFIADSRAEHDEAEALLSKLERCALEDEVFLALARRLEQLVTLHVTDEEQELLALLDEYWPSEALNDLGRVMEQRYDSFRDQDELRA